MHLTRIIQVMIGKNTKALRHEALDNISPECCFSVVAKKATLDLSSPNGNPLEARIFTAYLKGLQQHFIQQQARYQQQNPHGRRSEKGRSRSQNKERRHRDSQHRTQKQRHGDHHDRNASSSAPPPLGSNRNNDHQMSIAPLEEQSETEHSGHSPKKMKMSPIGQGFGQFKFDSNAQNHSESKPHV